MAKASEQNQYSEIFSYITENQYVYFATVQDNMPRIRTMTLFYYKGKFYFVTFTNNSKVAQIKNNKHCEVVLPIVDELGNKGQIKMTGKVKVCTDPDARQDAEYYCYFFDQFFDGTDDPDYCLLELEFETYEIIKPGESHSMKVHK